VFVMRERERGVGVERTCVGDEAGCACCLGPSVGVKAGEATVDDDAVPV